MRIIALDYHLPETVETLDDLKRLNPDWMMEKILSKTGVESRRIATGDETALSLGIKAAEKLLADRDLAAIDGLIYVTQSPDSRIPTTACLLHERLGLPKTCAAFDLNQGCSGFVYGLAVATSMAEVAGLSNCLVVCAETYTKYISRHDRTSRPVFSDGASAALIGRDHGGAIGPFIFHTDGSGAANLMLRSDRPAEDVDGPTLFMDGGKVLRFTTSEVPKATRALLNKAALGLDDIDLFLFHQASRIVLDKLQTALGIPPEKMLRNYREVGNTVSATIPILFKQAEEQGKIREGMTLMLMGFGVGYSLAGCIVKT